MKAAMKQDVLFRFLDSRLSCLRSSLEQTCLPLPPDTDELTTIWPDGRHLGELDSAVLALAVMERKKLPTSNWKAYNWVNKRWQRYHLVSRVEKLVRRARERLEEENEIDGKIAWPRQLNPDRFQREAFLDWIASLGNSEFLDVIDIVYDPDPQVWKGESHSLPHLIVKANAATRRVIAENRKRKQNRLRQRRRRDKERQSISETKAAKISR
ncbi:unnamed protein product [uncultured bacterium]|nr:unnamed protein product [uncultured bacterium]